MGLGIAGRMFQGIRSAINTVSVAEAAMAKTKETSAPQKFPELGVLQFGTRFKDMGEAINPFQSGTRPATGPTVSRPGQEQFKGTGGAFAPEQSLQLTSGLRGLNGPMQQFQELSAVASNNPQLAAAQGQFAEMGPLGAGFAGQGGLTGLSGMDPSSLADPNVMRTMQTQQMMQNIERMFQTLSSISKANHEIAMNSIRNLKA